MAIEIVDFPINSMVISHGKMLVHQRVIQSNYHRVFLMHKCVIGRVVLHDLPRCSENELVFVANLWPFMTVITGYFYGIIHDYTFYKWGYIC